jgi:hypothetical protein
MKPLTYILIGINAIITILVGVLYGWIAFFATVGMWLVIAVSSYMSDYYEDKVEQMKRLKAAEI